MGVAVHKGSCFFGGDGRLVVLLRVLLVVGRNVIGVLLVVEALLKRGRLLCGVSFRGVVAVMNVEEGVVTGPDKTVERGSSFLG